MSGENGAARRRRPAAGPDSASSSARPLEPLLTKEQAAAILGVKWRTVHRLMLLGELRVVRIGAAVRFRPDDVRRYIERQTTRTR